MVITIDAAGRMVIPKAMRDQLGLHGGVEVEVEVVAGHLEIHPKGPGIRIDHLPDGPVLVADGTVPPLTNADVRRLVDEDRAA